MHSVMKQASQVLAHGLNDVTGRRNARRARIKDVERRAFANRCAFLRTFIKNGSLVFDIGANRGRMTEHYVELGASVVAVEPHPVLSRHIRDRFNPRRVRVVPAAAADENGSALLRMCSMDDESTLTKRWMDRWHRFDDRISYDDAIEVRMLTADMLIEAYGAPGYCKVHAGGLEDAVIDGLSQPVTTVSFAYTTGMLDVTETVLDRLCELDDYRFNFTWSGVPWGLNLSDWTTSVALLDELEAFGRFCDHEVSGEIYATLLDEKKLRRHRRRAG